jgi:ATP-dependent exoDNAse (exonuclease V) beta subunit
LRNGRELNFTMVQQIYRYLPTNAVKRGFKSLPNAPEDGVYSMQLLQEQWGLNPQVATLIWHEALTKIPDEKREYVIALLRRGTRLMDKPQIKLSTIHAAKGGEADHVLLLTDLSAKSAQEYQSNPDDINRLLYVGLTRTRKSLHLVRPQYYDRAFKL